MLAKERDNEFKNKQGQCIALLEVHPIITVRHHDCSYIIPKGQKSRCSVCSKYRCTLNSIKSKNNTEQIKNDPHTNIRWLGKDQMRKEIKELGSTVSKQEQLIAHLQKKVENDNTLVEVDSKTHNDLITIMKENHNNIMKSHPEDSFQSIFWKNQFYASQQNSSTHFRWHPTIIKWCIFLSHKSSSAYNLLRSSKIIHLPSQRTLRDYSHYFRSTSGFSIDLDNQLINDSNISSLEDYQKHISLIGDEMYVKENLVFNKVTGELVGFCDVGDINNHLLSLEESYKRDGTEVNDMHNSTPTLAKTMLMIMVRGLFTDFTFPYASFPSTNLTGEQLVPIFLEALMRLEVCGFRVTNITLDGCSVNRKFFKIISDNSGRIKHKFNNPLSNGKRHVYLFSDPPHLIKTVRNCLANPKKNMQFNGRSISWDYVKQLYEMTLTSTGLTTLPKIRREHIYLTNFSKMRVDLAAQILSTTVAKAMRHFLAEEAEETVKFIEKFDKFFDMPCPEMVIACVDIQ